MSKSAMTVHTGAKAGQLVRSKSRLRGEFPRHGECSCAAWMPSVQHEAIVELFRDGEVVRTLLGLGGVVAVGESMLEDATLTVPELRADIVVMFGEGASRLVVVVEVQRNRDAQKQWTGHSMLRRRARVTSAKRAFSYLRPTKALRLGHGPRCELVR